MTRPVPLQYGRYYHIFNRGNNREDIFLTGFPEPVRSFGRSSEFLKFISRDVHKHVLSYSLDTVRRSQPAATAILD